METFRLNTTALSIYNSLVNLDLNSTGERLYEYYINKRKQFKKDYKIIKYFGKNLDVPNETDVAEEFEGTSLEGYYNYFKKKKSFSSYTIYIRTKTIVKDNVKFCYLNDIKSNFPNDNMNFDKNNYIPVINFYCFPTEESFLSKKTFIKRVKSNILSILDDICYKLDKKHSDYIDKYHINKLFGEEFAEFNEDLIEKVPKNAIKHIETPEKTKINSFIFLNYLNSYKFPVIINLSTLGNLE
ncbi:hypothetical protein N2W52_002088 [Clostridium perfringens]|nr:hypothetical protein [Clostridium perfringens]